MKPGLLWYAQLVAVISWTLCLPYGAPSAPLRTSLAKLSLQDSVCRVWVVFTDKKGSRPNALPSARAVDRRRRAGVAGFSEADVPVSRDYLSALVRSGCTVNQTFKWANAASVTIHASRLSKIAKLPYVNDILGVRSTERPLEPVRFRGLPKKALDDPSNLYGAGYTQLDMLNIPAVHRYIAASDSAAPGSGIVIGLFDTGFRLKHACFAEFIAGSHLMADSDFVDHDRSVVDPDSVVSDSAHPYFQNDHHGSMTLALLAGYDPPRFIGSAWGARFILARTEDNPVESHYEEDNWAAAIVWAESLGVDIVSSSLGYRDGFTLPDTDYTYQDMNGRTTIVSKAARQAADFGVIIVNGAGNEGPSRGSLVAPADVDSVIAVGAVDSEGAIAAFSSRGPASDGRIKPDCVAFGSGNTVPSIDGPDSVSYGFANGTSFAAPLVAGVCALIKQTHPHDAPWVTRDRLLASCEFVPGQKEINNIFGRGVPNAKLACLPYNIILFLKDRLGNPVVGTVFFRSGTGGAFLPAAADPLGIARLTDLSSDPVEFYAVAPEYYGSAHQNALPRDTGNYSLTVTLAARSTTLFVISPTVLNVRTKHQRLTLKFSVSADNPAPYSRPFSAAIHTMHGTLVWSTSRRLAQNAPLVLTWPPQGTTVAPGIYLFIVNYAGKSFHRKFIVTG